MRSGISCFDFTVWKKTFLRFWPIWTVNLVFWVLVMPFRGLTVLQREDRGSFRNYASWIGGEKELLTIFALILGLMAAMAAFSHLYNSRSANFMGSLPVRREGLFVSHYLAGLAMLLLPNLAVWLLTLLVELAGSAVIMTPLLFWLGSLCVQEFFFYSFAVCIGMFAGHILALPVFYGVFNLICEAMYFLVTWVLENFYYGWSANYYSRASEAVLWLTPVYKLASSVDCDRRIVSELPQDLSYTYQLEGVGVLLAYAGAALVLTACALLLYRRRHLETAGDVVAVRAMRPVFRYGVAFCSGMLFGFFTQSLLDLEEAGLMTAILLWGVAGCFVAQMLLDKTFRVFRKWKGAAAVAGAFILMFLVVGLDLTGYETRVPDPSQVAWMEVDGLGGEPSDGGGHWQGVRLEKADQIETAVALHREAVAQRDREVGSESWYGFGLELTYHLTNGSTMTRSYSLYCEEKDRDAEGSAISLAQRLMDDRELIWQVYGFEKAEELLARGGRLTEVRLSPSFDWESETYSYGYSSGAAGGPDIAIPETNNVEDLYFYGQDALELWDAVKADFAEGTIGNHTVARYDAELPTLIFNFELEEKGPAGVVVGSTTYVGVNIALPDTAEHTLLFLERKSSQKEP